MQVKRKFAHRVTIQHSSLSYSIVKTYLIFSMLHCTTFRNDFKKFNQVSWQKGQKANCVSCLKWFHHKVTCSEKSCLFKYD